MAHQVNIKIFLTAANESKDSLIQIYCGLVAIELALKEEIALKDHDVPSGIRKFRNSKAVGDRERHHFELGSLANKLGSDIGSIWVDKNGISMRAPIASYPNVRYARLCGDNWGVHETKNSDLENLVRTVKQIRAYLKKHFGLCL